MVAGRAPADARAPAFRLPWIYLLYHRDRARPSRRRRATKPACRQTGTPVARSRTALLDALHTPACAPGGAPDG